MFRDNEQDLMHNTAADAPAQPQQTAQPTQPVQPVQTAAPQSASTQQPVQPQTAPTQRPVQPVQPVQPITGSYYSPRSNGGAVPPVQEPVTPNAASAGGKKSSHKALKALGIFAGIAFLCFGSIQAYRFASENEALQKFFGRDDSFVKEETAYNSTPDKPDSDTPANTDSVATGSNGEEDTYDGASWIELAAREDALSIPDIVDKVSPATVGITSTFVWTESYGGMWGGSYEQSGSSTGTGIIMSANGYVITNAHVVYQSAYGGMATEIQVTLNSEYYEGETQIAATIVGYDVEEDIAVLKMDTTQKLVAAEFGDSDELRVGEMVVAIGNPLGLELFGSVSTGIVSALNRQVTINEVTMSLIQTDAAINSGNSGGPLINSYGQVIGINSAKMSSSYSSSSASIEGLGFAIPMTHAQEVIDHLIDYGYVRGKPVIGITARDVTEDISQAYGLPMGVYVTEVVDGGAADLAGIEAGDIIIAVNGKSVSNYDELNDAKNSFSAGDTITITAVRNGVDRDFDVVLQEKVPELS